MIDIVDFVQLVDIANIFVHEERGRRLVWSDAEKESVQFPYTTNSLGIITEGNAFRFRFRAVFTDEAAEYVADVEIVYTVESEVHTDDALRHEFAERVAFMAIYPFIRASIFGSAARLALPAPVMSIIRQGEFELGSKMTDEQTQEQFGDVRSETLRS